MNLLSEAFYQFPFSFDPEPLLEELAQCPAVEWQDNPQGFFGIESLVLVSNSGKDSHSTYGRMQACPRLAKLPRISELLSIFDAPLGATRVMRLAPNAKVQTHVDLHYYWKHRFRIHLVLETDPAAIFGCRDTVQHLPAGQVWVSDSWSPHFVENNSNQDRCHIVIDTLGSEKVWQWLNQSWTSSSEQPPAATLPLLDLSPLPLRFERYGDSLIKHPAQVSEIVQDILEDYPQPSALRPLLHRLDRGWKELWAEYATTTIFPYQRLLGKSLAQLETISPETLSSNQVSIPHLLRTQLGVPNDLPIQVKKPLFILGVPRSGQFELLQFLSQNSSFWRLPRTCDLFEHLPEFHPESTKYNATFLQDAELSLSQENAILQYLKQNLKHNRYRTWAENPNPLKECSFMDASPKNIFRIPTILKLFPDAQFIYLQQAPIQTLHALMNGWRTGSFVPYPDLPQWYGEYPWAFMLIPKWQSLSSKPLAEICFAQYQACHEQCIASLSTLPSERVLLLDIDLWQEDSSKSSQRLFRFLKRPQPKSAIKLEISPMKSNHQMQNAIELQPLFNKINQYHKNSVVTFR